MTLIEKVRDALRLPLIGSAVFSDEEINDLKKIARTEYEKTENRPDRRMYRLDVFVVLFVNLTKHWGGGSDGRFWQSIWEELFDDPDYSPSRYFYDDLEAVLIEYGKNVFRSRRNKRQFCEFIQFHSLAPSASFHSLIQLMWNFYLDEDLLNANYQTDHPLVKEFVLWFRYQFSDEDDSKIDNIFEFEGKTYAIRASIKYAFVQNDTTEMIGFAHQIFACMDRTYYREMLSESDCNYLLEKCESCLNVILHEQLSRGQKRRRQTTTVLPIDISRAYAAYELNERGIPVLIVPEIRMMNNDAEQIIIKVFVSNREVQTLQRYVAGEGIRRRIKQIEIDLASILEDCRELIDIRVELWVGSDCRYDSQEKLYRNFILFSQRREERGNILKPGDYMLVQISEESVEKVNCQCSMANNEYTWILTTQNETILSSADRAIAFLEGGSHTASCMWDGAAATHLSLAIDENTYPVFRSAPKGKLVFSQPYPHIKLLLDNQFEGFLQNLSYVCRENDLVWTIDLSSIDTFFSGIHRITIQSEDSVRPKLLYDSYIFISDRYQVKKPSSFCFGKSSSVFLCDETQRYEIYIDAESGIGQWPIPEGILHIAPPVLRWRIDSEEWCMQQSRQALWHRDPLFHNNVIIQIDAPEGNEVALFLGETPLFQSSRHKSTFLLGDALQSYDGSKATVNLKIGEKQIDLFTIVFQPILVSQPLLILESEELSFDAQEVYLGPENTEFELELYNDVTNMSAILQGISINDVRSVNLEDGFYTVEIFVHADEGLFASERRSLAKYEDIPLGTPYKFYFQDMQLRLEKTRYGDERGQIVRFSNVSINHITFLREEFYPVYQGTLNTKGQKRQEIEFVDKGDSIRIYYPSGEERKPASINVQSKSIVNATPDRKQIFPCMSVYYKEEYEDV